MAPRKASKTSFGAIADRACVALGRRIEGAGAWAATALARRVRAAHDRATGVEDRPAVPQNDNAIICVDTLSAHALVAGVTGGTLVLGGQLASAWMGPLVDLAIGAVTAGIGAHAVAQLVACDLDAGAALGSGSAGEGDAFLMVLDASVRTVDALDGVGNAATAILRFYCEARRSGVRVAMMGTGVVTRGGAVVLKTWLTRRFVPRVSGFDVISRLLSAGRCTVQSALVVTALESAAAAACAIRAAAAAEALRQAPEVTRPAPIARAARPMRRARSTAPVVVLRPAQRAPLRAVAALSM